MYSKFVWSNAKFGWRIRPVFLSSMYVTSYISLDNFLCINFPQTKAGKCSKAWYGPGEITEGTRTGAVGVIKELGFSGLHKVV